MLGEYVKSCVILSLFFKGMAKRGENGIIKLKPASSTKVANLNVPEYALIYFRFKWKHQSAIRHSVVTWEWVMEGLMCPSVRQCLRAHCDKESKILCNSRAKYSRHSLSHYCTVQIMWRCWVSIYCALKHLKHHGDSVSNTASILSRAQTPPGNTNMLSHADPPPYGHHYGCLGIRTPDRNGTKCFWLLVWNLRCYRNRKKPIEYSTGYFENTENRQAYFIVIYKLQEAYHILTAFTWLFLIILWHQDA